MDTSLYDALHKFMNGYLDAKSETFAGNPFGIFVRSEIPSCIYNTGLVDLEKYLITGSVGQGNWAAVPWICIFDRNITTSATRGVYIVYLLSKDGKSLYLTFNQGCTDIRNSHSKRETINIMREKAAQITNRISSRGFLVSDDVNLGERLTDLAEMYQRGSIFYRKYEIDSLPSEEDLRDDLSKMMDIYKEYVNKFLDIKWLPSLDEYTPKITKDKWLELLNDRNIFWEESLVAMACMMDNGGFGSCTELSNKYKHPMTLWRTSCGVHLASRIAEATGCEIKQEKGKNVWFVIPFLYKKAGKEDVGSYIYKLRPELEEALREYGIEQYFRLGKGEEHVINKDLISNIEKYISSKGFSFDSGLIENYYLSLKSKPFVILAGTSGTGKTRLVRLFAEAIGATVQNGRYKLVSVRPDWSDSSDLFGHVDLNGKFIPGAIIDFIKRASENKSEPYFLCLDEMNLARVEYYLADILSIIETRELVDGEIVTDPLITNNYYGADEAAKAKYGDLAIPENLYIIGTVNMDETTFPFSKKVLDRANTIEFSTVDFTVDLSDGEEVTPIHADNSFMKADYVFFKQCVDHYDLVNKITLELQSINKILEKANCHVGYRVRDEIVFYMLNNDDADLLGFNDAFDNELMQKILPRIQGSSLSIKKMLCELFKICAGEYEGYDTEEENASSKMFKAAQKEDCKYKHSAEKIAYMVRRFEEDGFTAYWL